VVFYLACAGRTREDGDGHFEAVHAADCYSKRDVGRSIYNRELNLVNEMPIFNDICKDFLFRE
jgi:hypothetical protein